MIPLTASPVNGLAENDNARIPKSRFLTQVPVRTVVCQHSTGEHVSLYRQRSEIYVQENIFVVSFHHFINQTMLITIAWKYSCHNFVKTTTNSILTSSHEHNATSLLQPIHHVFPEYF